MTLMRALTVLAATAFILGCASSGPAVPVKGSDATDETMVPTLIPVLRYGRYTLVEVLPQRAQQDLMSQIIDVTIPPATNATVGDALRLVLSQSGYQLCEGREEIHSLNVLPLPAAHTRLGPLTLRDALQVLAGRAWKLEVDETRREVCFTRRDMPKPIPNARLRDGGKQR